jgi:2-polyprenyl-6-hydroxyphenyl methylase/3-demethylubiquinone-9 3-methyltransferase
VELGALERDDGEDVGGNNSTDPIKNSIHERVAEEHARQLRTGQRFRFGRNWTHFLKRLNEERIAEAEDNLTEFLGRDSLRGKTFLDIGSGSGLSSLAARRLGAVVTSFDFDTLSVACTEELRRRFFPDDPFWRVGQGSILDKQYIDALGQFDIVYSWGVLHHTGAMWQAMENVKQLVKWDGLLFIAIYNDAGELSRKWQDRKRRYNALPSPLRLPYAICVWTPEQLRILMSCLRSGGLRTCILELRGDDTSRRGMSRLHDIVDWVGGYPYEYAKIEMITEFYSPDGFKPVKLRENRSYGCHQIVFKRGG